MDGLLRCSQYSFGPNRLHYCGPDANAELLGYIKQGVADPGLEQIVRRFETLYPYLQLIASVNHIPDPFDERVVEAYWIGNSLLQNVSREQLFDHLVDRQGIKKKISRKDFRRLEEKIAKFALPHHSFHVLNIWRRTGHLEREHTLESLESCRVSWGEVVAVDGPKITIKKRPLVYRDRRLFLGDLEEAQITRQLESVFEIEQLRPGALISTHWDAPCEVVTPEQAKNLEKFTLQSLALANQTI